MSLQLTYFEGRGVAEVTRILLALAHVEYEDNRLPDDEFDRRQAAGLFTANLDRLPILKYDGVEIGQSKTIERFVARKYGFLGSNEVEAALIDAISEHVRDIKLKYNEARNNKSGEELETARKNFLVKDFPVWVSKIEKVVGENGYAVGNKISLADVSIFNILEDYFDLVEDVQAAVAGLPKLRAIAANVKEAAKDWIQSRPVTQF